MRLTRQEDGFTVLELLVVLIIIALLAGVAIPIFLNQQRETVDASVKSDVRNTVNDVQDWVQSHPGVAVPNTAEFMRKSGRTVLSSKDTLMGITIDSNGKFTICAFNPGGNKLKVSDQAWSFDSSTGKFGVTADGTCAGAVTADGGNDSIPASIPQWSSATSLPRANVNYGYSVLLTATGKPTPTYVLHSGSTLPGGFQLDEFTGRLHGVPLTTGLFKFTVDAKNSEGSVSRNFELRVVPSTTVPEWNTGVALPDGQVDKGYGTTLDSTATPNATYQLEAGSHLPAGLALSSSTGKISGTPTAAGDTSFTVLAKNSAGSTPRTFYVHVRESSDPAPTPGDGSGDGGDSADPDPDPGTGTGPVGGGNPTTPTTPPTSTDTAVSPEWSTPAALKNGTQNSAYSADIDASASPAATYALVSGESLPAGLKLNQTSGAISGKPTAYGSFSFKIVARNSEGSVSRTFTMSVARERIAPSWTTAAALGAGEQNTAYSADLNASGYPAPAYALAPGSDLPDGLSLNASTGLISGTPAGFGSFTFSIVATNAEGSSARSFTVKIASERVAPTFTTASNLSDGEQGETYEAQLATAGNPDPTYTISAGALPDGLSLNLNSGLISGTPSVYGNFSFSVTASNSKGEATRSFNMQLAKHRVSPSWTTQAALPAGEQNSDYSYFVAATGEPAPALELAGTLPSGLNFNAATGEISGTPTVFGSFSFSINASNSKGSQARTFTLVVGQQRFAPVFTGDVSLHDGEQGEAYTQQLTATGFPEPTFGLASGSSLPAGVSLSNSGEISGTPTVYGNFIFTVIASNSKGNDSQTFFLNIAQQRVVPVFSTDSALPNGEQTIAYSTTIAASGVPAPTFTLASGSALPAGLSLNSTTGVLSGTPSVYGDFFFTITAANSKLSADRTFTLSLAKQRVAPAFTSDVALADGEQGVSYSTTVSATGEPAPTYSIASGSDLPAGLNLNSTTGVLSGTPSVYGNFIFTVTASNSKGSANRTFFLYLAQARVVPAFTTGATLPDGEQTIAYSTTVAASGVPAPTFTLASASNLPGGLSLNSTTGVISGTPSVYGSFSFTVTATNSKGSTSRTFSLSLAKQRVAPAFTTAATLPAAEQTVAYSAVVSATGEPAATYTVATGSDLPSGLSLNSTTGVLAGTPSAYGSFSFTVTASNSKGNVDRTFSLSVAKQRVVPAFTTGATLPVGEQTVAYSTTISATGEPAATFKVASGSTLPAGLTLDGASGVLSGTPTVFGSFSFMLTATNSKGSVDRTFTLVLAKQRVVPAFTTDVQLVDGEQASVYSAVVSATGEPAPTYSIASGSALPAGLNLDATSGSISGTPSVYGSFIFTVTATNSKGSADRTFFLTVAQQRVAPAFTTGASLPDGEQTVAYSTTVSASGVPVPTFSVASGSNLPAGLSLNSTTGVLSGTPTVFGTFSFTLTATNSKGSIDRGFNLTLAKQRVAPNFTTTAALADGEQGSAYSALLSATGEPAATFAVASGSSLPAGMSLSSAGALSGTPTVSGSFSFAVIASNSKGSDTRTFTLTLAPTRVGPTFTTNASLPAGEQTVAYNATIAASGVPTPTYALAAGSNLPAGLSLDATSGAISGAPTVFGSFAFTITASNSKGSIDRVFSLTLAKQRVVPAFTTAAALPDGEQTISYSTTIAATGEPAPTYAVASGSSLPTGLALDASSGLISGTPSVYGNFSFTINANNSKGTASRTFTLTLAQQRVVPTFTTAAALADGEQATAYSATIAATGQPSPLYSLATGSTLPTGLALDTTTGAISGTPSVFGSFAFTITAANSKGSINRGFTLTLAKQRVVPAFTGSATLPAGEVATAYSTTLTATGEPAPTFAVAAGSSLPAGLSLNSTTGVISGTPTADGSSTVTFSATNSKGSTTRGFVMVIAKQRVVPVFTSSAALVAGEQGTAYSASVTATGEPAPTYALATGSSLPSGLALNLTSGAISGTPTVYGTFSFTITATNSKGSTTRTFTTTIAQQRVEPTFVTDYVLPGAVQGTAYSVTVNASGVPAPTYSIPANYNLPAGLSLNSTTGVISGTPTVYGNFSFFITASNSKGSIDKGFVLAITQQATAPAFNTGSALPNALVGSSYSQTISTSGFPAATYSIASGTLPAGLALNTTTGAISGTPTAATSGSFTLNATNASGTATRAFTLQVNEAPSVQNANLASGQLDQSYSQTINTLGTPVPTISMTGLPAGLSYNSTTRSIVGTPTASGTFTVTISVVNSVGSGSKAYTLTVAGRAATPTNVRTTKIFGNQATVAWDAVAGATGYQVTFTGANSQSFTTTATSAMRGGLTINADPSNTTVSVVATANGLANSNPGTGTVRMPGYRLVNAALYSSSCPSAPYSVTADCAITSADGSWTAVMQPDGNFVNYKNYADQTVKAFWATQQNIAGAYVSMQTDTNLVTYQSNGTAIKSTNTSYGGNPGGTLTLQNDGNMIVTRNSDGVQAWLSIDNGNPNSNTTFMLWVAGSNVTMDNASAENDTSSNTQWSQYFGPAAGFTTEDKHDGNRSYKITTTGNNPEGFINGANFQANAGERIYINMWVKGTAGENWSIAGRTNPYAEGMGAYNLQTNGQWQQINVVYTVPNVGTIGQIFIQARQGNQSGGKVLYSDQMNVYRSYPG